MLPVFRAGQGSPLVVLLHWLGGGAQTWTEVCEGLAARGVRCVALDLPGFGSAASRSGFSVAAMSDAVAETVRSLRDEVGPAAPVPWLIAGHSMGGAVAAHVARRALDGEPGLDDLRGILLVSPSPPGPEPMSDGKRELMLASLGGSTGNHAKDRDLAARFVDENTGKLPLPPAVRERAIAGVLGMNRTALRHWLEYGSRENWSTEIGELRLPALVFAGTDDAALGPEAQREHTMPHLPEGELVALANAGHLAPLERPGELIERMTQFIAEAGLTLSVPETQPGPQFESLLASERVSPKTREVMQARLAASENWDHLPVVFSPAEFRTLRALAGRVVPGAGFDIAARIDDQLAKNKGDGWRFAALPPDREAWQQGLHSLDLAAERAHGVPFVALFSDRQDDLLQQAAEGKLGRGVLGALHLADSSHAYTATEMKRWFEEVRAECSRLYMGDPRTMDRVGYNGFADDFGFTHIRLEQQREFGR